MLTLHTPEFHCDIVEAATEASKREHTMRPDMDVCSSCGKTKLEIVEKRLFCGPWDPTIVRKRPRHELLQFIAEKRQVYLEQLEQLEQQRALAHQHRPQLWWPSILNPLNPFGVL